jgi:hypothetical protein
LCSSLVFRLDFQQEEALADQKTVAALIAGAATWDRWLADNQIPASDAVHDSSIIAQSINLTEARLEFKNLNGMNLKGANLAGARLIGASLRGACLDYADLRGANLAHADLQGASLCEAQLQNTVLRHADITGATLECAVINGGDLTATNLTRTSLRGAELRNAILRAAELAWADLTFACLADSDLTGASLFGTRLISADLSNASLDKCAVYGVAVWDVKLSNTRQRDLVVSPMPIFRDERTGELYAGRGDMDDDGLEFLVPAAGLTTDNLETAQVLYLFMENPNIRGFVDSITTRAVLILGRFVPERKLVLDALREALRGRGWIPILFDFAAPTTRDTTETVSTLAHLSRFVVADLTEAASVLFELGRIIPNLPSLPVCPIIEWAHKAPSMFEDLLRYPWVLEPYYYRSVEGLLADLVPRILIPAEAKAKERRPQGR